MKKWYEDMTLDELWRLFPIELKPHDGRMVGRFAAERERIAGIFPAGTRISHVGSTAIDIAAKPIVDILVELPPEADMERAATATEGAGYIRMSDGGARKSFNRGYTPEGFAEEVFHLHLRRRGDNDELYFRDYLAEFPSVAAEYEELKRRLAEEYKYDRDGYTAAKGDFVTRYTALARARYGDRY